MSTSKRIHRNNNKKKCKPIQMLPEQTKENDEDYLGGGNISKENKLRL